MGSFTDLNQLFDETLEADDLRNPGIETDVLIAPDIDLVETGGLVLDFQTGINIIDIIRPDDADVKLIIDLTSVSGTTASWAGTQPETVTITEFPLGKYTITLNSVSDWEFAKTAKITMPEDFQGSFFYTAGFEYTTNEGTLFQEWTVGTFIPVSQFILESSFEVIPSTFKDSGDIILQSISTQEVYIEDVQLVAHSALSVIPEYIFTADYLSLVSPATYTASILNDISTDAPRVTLNNEVDELTVEIFSTEPGFIDQLSSDGFSQYETATTSGSWSGTFVDFINDGTSFITKQNTFGGTISINRYSYPEIALETSFSVSVETSAFFVAVAVSEDGSTIAIGDPEYSPAPLTNRGRVFFYTLSGGSYSLSETVLGNYSSNQKIGVGVGVSSDGNTILAGTEDGRIDIYNVNGTKIADISNPSGINFIGAGRSRIKSSNSGNRFIISGSGTLNETAFLYTITNFSPFAATIVELPIQSYDAILWLGNSDFSLVGVNNQICNSSGNIIQTFTDQIESISPDGTHVAVKDGSDTRFVYTGNSSIGWTYTYDVQDAIALLEELFFKQDNSELFNYQIRRVLEGNSGVSFNNTTKTLTLTGKKSQINQCFDSLSLTPNAVTGTYEMNYKLTAPSITYTRRQDFTD